MELEQFSDRRLAAMSSDFNRLRKVFSVIMDGADVYDHAQFLLPGVKLTMEPSGELIRVAYGSIEVDLILTFSMMGDGNWIGRVTAVLTKHPLERCRVQLGRFSIDRMGMADFTLPGAGHDPLKLESLDRALVLTCIVRALKHLPAQPE